jgi:hypothetical protein
MTEKAIPINPGFSTADAESVSFSLQKGNGILEFLDWREQPVKVHLEGTIALKWQEADSHGPEARDDMSFEIEESEWLRDHLTQNITNAEQGHRRYKFCFNAVGILEVICRTITLVIADNQDLNPSVAP